MESEKKSFLIEKGVINKNLHVQLGSSDTNEMNNVYDSIHAYKWKRDHYFFPVVGKSF